MTSKPRVPESLEIVRADALAHQRIGDEVLIMTVRDRSVHTIGGIGVDVWEMAAEPTAVHSMIERIAADYGEDIATVRDDVKGFVADLISKRILKYAKVPTAPAKVERMEMFEHAARAQTALGKPITATHEITYRCNQSCCHCYVPKHVRDAASGPESSRRLEHSQVLQILDRLHDAGVFEVTVSGGEPFMYPRLGEYLEHAAEIGLALRMFSNLSAPSPDRLDQLFDKTVYKVETSFFGADAATHDAFTQTPGSFDRMIASVERLVQRGMLVVMKTNWTKHHFRSASAMVRLAAELGASFLGTVKLDPQTDGSTENMAYAMSDDELYEFFFEGYRAGMHEGEMNLDDDDPMVLSDREGSVCGAGQISVRVDPFGDLFPCVELPTRAGNVLATPIDEILRDSPVIRRLRSLDRSDLVYDHGEPYDRSVYGPCSVCPAANLRECGDMKLVSHSAKRMARVRYTAEQALKKERRERGEG